MAASFGRRFDELCQQAQLIEDGKRMERPEFGIEGYRVDSQMLLNWIAKARHLMAIICGEKSQYFQKWDANESDSIYITNYEKLGNLLAILNAAKEDYDRGYLNTARNLIQANVFDNELEQASELLNAGYIAAAAVIAGVVLETTLRQMCADNHLHPGKLDKMGADLAKSGFISKLVQKQITAWADVRNSAAHGNTAQYNAGDVDLMIRDVSKFVADVLV